MEALRATHDHLVRTQAGVSCGREKAYLSDSLNFLNLFAWNGAR
jgi:hypothetical protein